MNFEQDDLEFMLFINMSEDEKEEFFLNME